MKYGKLYKAILILIYLNLSVFVSYAQFRKLEKRHHSVNKTVKEIIAEPEFKNADFAFLAVDNKTGEVIASYCPDKTMIPASTQKLFTTAAALEILGPEFKFSTLLQYTGHIDTVSKILYGNIIIKGGGDPTLGSKYFDSTKKAQFLTDWVLAIKQAGIDSVAGAVIGDASVFDNDIVPITWSRNNTGNYFGAGANGLTVFDNYYTLYFDIPDTIGCKPKIIKIVPEIPGLTFDNEAESDSIKYDNLNILGAPYSNIRYLRGKLPAGKKDFGVKGSMPDPAYMAAYTVEKILKKNGIGVRDKASTLRISGNISENRILLTKTDSPELSEIIKQTNTHSVNLFAEHLLKQIGLKLTGNSVTEYAADNIVKFWNGKNIDTQGMYLFDGSGLSRYDGFTPSQMVGILSYMKNKSRYFTYFYNSLPVAGETGTMKNMLKETLTKGKLRAKSGTVSRVKAYAGYVTSVSGRDIIFSMVVNNFSCSSKKAKAQLEKLMIALAAFKK